MANLQSIELGSEWLCMRGLSVAPTVPTLGMTGSWAAIDSILSTAYPAPENFFRACPLARGQWGEAPNILMQWDRLLVPRDSKELALSPF